MLSPYHEDADTPFAITIYQWLFPGIFPDQELVASILFRSLGCDSFSQKNKSSMGVCLNNNSEAYFDEYRKSIELLNDEEEEIKSAANNFHYEANMQMVRNEDHWVVIKKDEYEYSGGAHGNSVTSFYNLDLELKKEWKLKDVLNTDSLKLRLLLDLSIRKYFDLPSHQRLRDRLLVQQIPITENFFPARGGLVFCYLPYEIASYADGNIFIFISYNELKDLLSIPFKERLHLELKGPIKISV